MTLNFLGDIRRECFMEAANELINHYCILKHDSRDDRDVIYRFAEIEFYLYDANEMDKDTSTYCRDCQCVEWFFHGSGVDIAFETEYDGNELIRFGGILIRGIEIYRQGVTGEWNLTGVVGGPRLSMYEIFNHCSEMPDIVAIPDTFKTDRSICDATRRIGIKDGLLQRFVVDDVNWDMPTERIVGSKDADGRCHAFLKKTTRKYEPKCKG
ncbi:MAG: hypothetical protein ACI3Z7_04865 [Candidatus Aphodosoma sp.]